MDFGLAHSSPLQLQLLNSASSAAQGEAAKSLTLFPPPGSSTSPTAPNPFTFVPGSPHGRVTLAVTQQRGPASLPAVTGRRAEQLISQGGAAATGYVMSF